MVFCNGKILGKFTCMYFFQNNTFVLYQKSGNWTNHEFYDKESLGIICLFIHIRNTSLSKRKEVGVSVEDGSVFVFHRTEILNI